MEELNKNEEAVMRILWEIERGIARDVIDKMPEPKPPYTTVSSVIRFLEKAEKVVSFMVKEKKLKQEEIKEIKKLIEDYEKGEKS